MAVSQSASILVVDDQPTSVAVTQTILTKLGFENVDTAISVTSAMKQVRSKSYDVVISDWHMPSLDGPELFRQVKKMSPNKLPKFYFLTMDARWGCAATARQLGAEALIVKPCRPGELLNKISRALLDCEFTRLPS
jgi:two-component system chemotaxis response regulator CheY